MFDQLSENLVRVGQIVGMAEMKRGVVAAGEISAQRISEQCRLWRGRPKRTVEENRDFGQRLDLRDRRRCGTVSAAHDHGAHRSGATGIRSSSWSTIDLFAPGWKSGDSPSSALS